MIYPRSKHWYFIDYAIVRRKDRQDVKETLTEKVQTVGQITGLTSANLTCAFSLYGDHKTRKCQRDWVYPSWNKTQEASIHQWDLQAFRFTRTQFRGSRWELDSLQTPFTSAMDSLGSVSCNTKTGLMKILRNPGTPWRETLKAQGTSAIPTQYIVRLSSVYSNSQD